MGGGLVGVGGGGGGGGEEGRVYINIILPGRKFLISPELLSVPT